MPDTDKEGLFGGLPDSLFNQAVAFLQGVATNAAASPQEVAAAVSVLASLAQSEHAAAVSTFEVRPIDAVFRVLEVDQDLKALNGASGANLLLGLAALKAKLDNLALFWKGQ